MMNTPTKPTLFEGPKPRSETVMDKTTRVVREILDEETQQRDVRTSRLRKARLEREAGARKEAIKAAPKTARKKPEAKTAG